MRLETILLIFTILVAIALLIQAIAVFLIYRKVAALTETVDRLIKQRIASILAAANELVVSFKPIVENIKVINNNLTSISAIARERVSEVGQFVGETTDTARLQVAKIDDLISNTTSRFDEVAGLLQRGIMTPIIEISALVKGVRAGFDFLISRGSNGRQPRRAAQDEELFI